MAITLEQEVGELLRKHHLMMATAESATGGMISVSMINVPGSSKYFEGAVVSYSNRAKVEVLGVKQETLDKYGSVSCQVAKEMADGVRRLLKVDVALSDTGTAGPAGGTDRKPVGLFYIGLATPDGTQAQERLFKGDRQQNRADAARAALSMLKEYLLTLK